MSSALETGGRSIDLIPTTVLAGASIIGSGFAGMAGMKYLTATAVFARAAGGTTCKVYIQSSMDGGLTWSDMICIAFATTTANKSGSVVLGSSNPAASTDGTLTDDTTFAGAFGSMLRAKAVVVGTYSGASSIKVSVTAKA